MVYRLFFSFRMGTCPRVNKNKIYFLIALFMNTKIFVWWNCAWNGKHTRNGGILNTRDLHVCLSFVRALMAFQLTFRSAYDFCFFTTLALYGPTQSSLYSNPLKASVRPVFLLSWHLRTRENMIILFEDFFLVLHIIIGFCLIGQSPLN